LRATVENTGDRTVELNTRIEAVLWPMHSEERSPGVSVGPGRSGEGPCWRAQGTVTQLSTSRPLTLDPGERESSTLSVLGYRENEDVCLPTGTFRFVDDYPSLGSRDWTVEFTLRIDAVE
jgi:hypothetical protein